MAIYKHGQGFELGTTENKSGKWPEQDLNPGLPDCKSDTLTTRPCCLLCLLLNLEDEAKVESDPAKLISDDSSSDAEDIDIEN